MAGFFSAIPPFIACSVGILTAAFLGARIVDMPIYTAIGYAVSETNPYIAGIFLAAILAAVISTFSPLVISFSHILIEDIICRLSPTPVSDKTQRALFPISIIVISSLCACYVVTFGIKNIMPFVFSTAFPCTIPITIVTFYGLHFKNTSDLAAFLSISIGVPVSLIWGLVFDNPFGIPNIYLAFLMPVIILVSDQFIQKMLSKKIPQEAGIL